MLSVYGGRQGFYCNHKVITIRMKIIITIAATVLFLLVLSLLRLGIKQLAIRHPGLKFSENLMAGFELSLWLAYIILAADFLFHGKFYYNFLVYALIIVITGFLAWFLLKDIIAGVIFRGKHNLKYFSYLRAGDYSGQLQSHHFTFMKIITGDGQIIRIPYSKVIHEVITELTYPGEFEEHVLNILVDLSVGKSIDAESLIRTVILNSPWSNLNEEPSIKFLKESGNGYYYETTLFSINQMQMKNIEVSLKEIPAIHVLESGRVSMV